ncbi:MAG: hypothetical protein ABSD56_09060 [Bryobacteraceae bacterium]
MGSLAKAGRDKLNSGAGPSCASAKGAGSKQATSASLASARAEFP